MSHRNVAPNTHTHMPNHKKTTDGSDTCTPPRLMASKQSTTTTCLLRLNGGESRKMPQPKCQHASYRTHTQDAKHTTRTPQTDDNTHTEQATKPLRTDKERQYKNDETEQNQFIEKERRIATTIMTKLILKKTNKQMEI